MRYVQVMIELEEQGRVVVDPTRFTSWKTIVAILSNIFHSTRLDIRDDGSYITYIPNHMQITNGKWNTGNPLDREPSTELLQSLSISSRSALLLTTTTLLTIEGVFCPTSWRKKLVHFSGLFFATMLDKRHLQSSTALSLSTQELIEKKLKGTVAIFIEATKWRLYHLKKFIESMLFSIKTFHALIMPQISFFPQYSVDRSTGNNCYLR